jgi:hypothetical protein
MRRREIPSPGPSPRFVFCYGASSTGTIRRIDFLKGRGTMNSFGKLCSIWLVLTPAGTGDAQPAKDYPPGWPRPGATLLVENDRGAAYNVEYPKDQPTPMHRHRYFFAGLDLNTATIRVTQPDGKSALHPVIKNRMWFLPKDLTHQEMSTTDPGRHTVVIDIKDKHLPKPRTRPTCLTASTPITKVKWSTMSA